MWILSHQSKPDVRHVLLVGQEYVVGRKDCDILVPDDMSISRRHAIVSISHPETNISNPDQLPVLMIKDISRLGSVIRGSRIKDGQQATLQSGDTVMFGTAGTSFYQAVFEPLLVTTSCLDPADKRTTKQLLQTLGGHLVNEWRTNTQLVIMTKLSVTIKVICALISQKHIVLPGYLDALKTAVKNGIKHPQPSDYLPPLSESQINPSEVSFQPKPQRKLLFKDRVFIFLNAKQMRKLGQVIELAGGSAQLMESGSGNKSLLTAKNTCVINSDPADMTQNYTSTTKAWIEQILSTLKKHGLRAITEPELGFSVLYCSTDAYCNPHVAPPGAVSQPLIVQSLTQQLPNDTMTQSATSQPAKTETAKMQAAKTEMAKMQPAETETAKVQPAKTETAKREPAKMLPVKAEPGMREPVKMPPPKTQPIIPQPAKKQPAKTERVETQPAIPQPAILQPQSTTLQDQETEQRNQHNKRPRQAALTDFVRDSPSKKARSVRDDQKITEPVDTAPGPQGESDDQQPDDVLNFDSIPTRRKRKLAANSPSTTDHTKCKEERRSVLLEEPKSGIADGKTEKTASKAAVDANKMQDDADTASAVDPRDEFTFDDIAPRGRRGGKKTAAPPTCHPPPVTVKTEIFSPDITDNNAQPKSDPKSKPTARSSSPTTDSGFLSARGQKTNMTYVSPAVKEEGLPCGLIQTVTVDLMVQRSSRQPVPDLTGETTWKGKVVKNFKKFSKSGRLSQLPMIIGGSDLIPHVKRNRPLEEWMQQELEEQSQQREESRIAQEMFDFKSKVARGRKR